MVNFKKKKIMSPKEKYSIICELDKGTKQSEISRLKKISPSVISNIKKNKEKIITALKTRSLKTKKVRLHIVKLLMKSY
ncbi:hypothetical protein ENBRE01_2184 [Enteropsectra breve]|nr:hypothetical protein ENBRE01_2184 [Enteropsectra breve]